MSTKLFLIAAGLATLALLGYALLQLLALAGLLALLSLSPQPKASTPPPPTLLPAGYRGLILLHPSSSGSPPVDNSGYAPQVPASGIVTAAGLQFSTDFIFPDGVPVLRERAADKSKPYSTTVSYEFTG